MFRFLESDRSDCPHDLFCLGVFISVECADSNLLCASYPKVVPCLSAGAACDRHRGTRFQPE